MISTGPAGFARAGPGLPTSTLGTMGFPSPIPLSLALAGFNPPGVSGLRSQIERASALGFRAVTLNASAPDARPRDLGRSARRDLAALIRRHSMKCAGVDLWLPPEHLVQPAHAQRATDAMLEAAEFAGEMAELTGGAPVLSTALLARTTPGMGPILAAVRDRAESHNVRVADHRWPRPAKTENEEPEYSALGIGIDPAAMFLAAGPLADPASAVSRLGARVFSARLSDANMTGRCEVGAGGRLDTLAYGVALSTAGYLDWLVVDVRGLRDSENGAKAALNLAAGSEPRR